MIRYLKLLRPPTARLSDTLVYVLLCLVTAISAPPASILKRRTLRQSVSIIFTSLMPRDLLIDFMGVRFLARRGRSDMLLLNPLSSTETWDYFNPREGDVVVDIGAHVGKYALVAAKRVGTAGKVVAIEAHPENFRALADNTRINDFRNVFSSNTAAFNEDGKRLRLFGQWDAAYSLKAWHPQCISVDARTTDSILRQHGINSVDWVKIDVEGAEVDVLAGMKKVIGNSPNLRILIEVSPSNEQEVDDILGGFRKTRIKGRDMLYWRDRVEDSLGRPNSRQESS
jgi:FkbM family methyltransferase